MICKDCEMEVAKLTRAGICKRCQTRISNAKHRGIEYEPLRIVKVKDPGRYNRAMSLRDNNFAAGVRNISAQPAKTETKEENLRDVYYSKVAKDISEEFAKRKITQNYLQHKNLDSWVDTFFSLLQEDNFISDAKEGEQVFNSLSLLYRHSQENLSWDDIDKINDISYILKALAELRRPTKELLDFYISIDPVITYLKNDKNFISLLSQARLDVLKKSENHENPGYYSDVNSNLLQDTAFLGVKDKAIKVFDCTVWCYNLNGDPNRRLFRANGGILAKNQIEAKLKFKAFLKDKFSTVTYKDKDITIEEVESVEVVRQRAGLSTYSSK